MNLRNLFIIILIFTSHFVRGQMVGMPYMVNIVPNPIINSFTTNVNTINEGMSTILIPDFVQGTARIDNGVGIVISGEPYTVTPSVTTTYTITVTNEVGRSISQSITIYVNTLIINNQPTDATVNTNEFYSLTVNATGSGLLTYQWYNSSGIMPDYVSNTYRSNQPGSFYVIITSTLDGVSKSITSDIVTVIINGISITTQPSSGMFGTGGTFELNLIATGSGTLSYQWYKGVDPIIGANANSYLASVEDAYYVEVTSTLNGVSNKLRSNGVYVSENKVTITSQPQNAYFTTGYSTSIVTSYSYISGANLSFQWYNNAGIISGAINDNLTVTSAGDYYLVISSQLNGTTGTTTSTVATITEVPAPEIVSFNPDAYAITLGSSTTITPIFTGSSGTINPGNISVASGQIVSLNPTVSTPYTLTVRNLAGTQTSFQTNVNVTTGTFTLTSGQLAYSKDYSKSILLDNGKVLIASANYSYATAAEVYDPSTQTFSRTSNDMSAAGNGRTYGGAVKLQNGKVLFVGGMNYTKSAEIYDPATNLFTLANGLASRGRQRFTTTLLNNGQVLITGGYDGTSDNATSELYDPISESFSSTGNMMSKRSDHTATKLNDGTVLIVGGFGVGGTIGISNTAEIYNPITGTFSRTTGNLNKVRQQHTATLLNNGKVLIVSGVTNSGSGNFTTSDAELYDPATKTFTLINMPSGNGRLFHQATLLANGKVLITGGATSTYSVTYADGLIFDPITNTFYTEASTMINARRFHTACLLNDGTVLIVGGYYPQGATIEQRYTKTAEIFKPD